MASARMTRKQSVAQKSADQKINAGFRAKSRRFSPWSLVLITVAVLTVCFFVKAELETYAETLEYRQEYEALKEAEMEVNLSIAEKEVLRDSLLAGDASDETIIRIIRSRGYVYPDEVIFYDVDQGE